MSQCSTTMLGSCGLMVGAIIVPPPPGPTMVQGSKRGAGPDLVAARAIAGSIHARTVVRFIGVPYLSARRTRQHIPRGKPWDRQPVSGKLRRKLGVSPGFAAHLPP